MRLYFAKLVRDGVLASSDWAHGGIGTALPFAVRVLSFQANEAEVAAAFARHVFAGVDVCDEQATLGTRSRVRASFHASDLLRSASFQRLQVTFGSLAVGVSTSFSGSFPGLRADPAERCLAAGPPGTSVAHDLVDVATKSTEVSLAVRLTRRTPAHLSLASVDEVGVDAVEVPPEFGLRLDGRQDVADDEEVQVVFALRAAEFVAAVRQRRLTHHFHRFDRH